jgi:hypothetical protein
MQPNDKTKTVSIAPRFTNVKQERLDARRVRALAKRHGVIIPTISKTQYTYDDCNLLELYADYETDLQFINHVKEASKYFGKP